MRLVAVIGDLGPKPAQAGRHGFCRVVRSQALRRRARERRLVVRRVSWNPIKNVCTAVLLCRVIRATTVK